MIGFQPVELEQKKDGNHEHLRTDVMKKRTGWNPIPRAQTMCSTPRVGHAALPRTVAWASHAVMIDEGEGMR